MFSMCSELTPRAPIPDSRIAQFMQPCLSTPQPSGCKRLPRWFLDTFIRRGFHRLDAYTVKAVLCITCANSLWIIHAIPDICYGSHGYTRVKFFLAGVNFYRFNAKNWQFTVYFAIITQKIGNFLCILS